MIFFHAASVGAACFGCVPWPKEGAAEQQFSVVFL